MQTIIAIDPGKSGGLVVQCTDTIAAHKMPETAKDLYDLLHSIKARHLEASFGAEGQGPASIRCYMEKVGGYVGDSGNTGSSMFSFGRGVGHLEMAMIALEIPTILVTPGKWQNNLGVGNKIIVHGDYSGCVTPEQREAVRKQTAQTNARYKSDWKKKLLGVAQQLYPYIKVTLGNADALLLLEFARRQEKVQAPQAPQKEMTLS